MAIQVVRCAISGVAVTRVTDLEGRTTRLICPDYDESSKTCRIRRATLGGGPLAQLLDRLSEGTLDRRGTHCDLA